MGAQYGGGRELPGWLAALIVAGALAILAVTSQPTADQPPTSPDILTTTKEQP